jgi:hypothetical protein
VLDLVAAFKPSMVLLRAGPGPQSAAAGSLYFPSERLPMRADLFGRAAWQLRVRAGAAVYAWLPVEAAGRDANTMLQVYEDLGRSGLFTGFGFGLNFLAVELQQTRLPDDRSSWDPRTPRYVRAAQDRAALSQRARLWLGAIENVDQYQSNLKVLDGVELQSLRPPSEVAADSVDSLAVRWDGKPREALRKLDELGWLGSPMADRIVYMSSRDNPDEWRIVQQAGLLNGIYCPDRLFDRLDELKAMSRVLGAASYPFRP